MKRYSINQLKELKRKDAKEVLTLVNEDLSRLPYGTGTMERRRELKKMRSILYARIMKRYRGKVVSKRG